jgi:transcriptional regulator with XRE-family HTH domain
VLREAGVSEDSNMSRIDESKDSTAEQTPEPRITVDVVGSRIREMREARGRSIEEVAEGAGLTPAALEAMESGKADPMLTELIRIAASLGVPTAQIFSSLSPAAAVVGASFDEAPEDLQGAVRTILTHPWVKS